VGALPSSDPGRPAPIEVAERPHRSGRLARNLGVLSAGQLVTWTTSLVWTLFVPRAVGPGGMGLLVMYWSVGSVMTTLAGMGTKTLVVREVSADRQRASSLIGSSFYLRAFTVAPVLLLTASYIKLGSFGDQRAVVIWLAFLATVINLFTDPIQAAFQGIERMEYLALGDVLVKTFGAAGAIALVLLGMDALAIVIYSLVLGWILLVMYLALIRRHIRIALNFDWAAILGLFRESLSFWAFTVTTTIYFWVDSILLSLLAPADQLGWYGAPTKLTATLMFVPTIIWAVWLPRLSSAHRDSPDELRQTARTPLELSLVLAIPVSVGALLVAAPIIATLYGKAFGPSSTVFAVLALTVLPVYLNTGFGYILIASKRQVAWTLVMGGAAIANVALNLVLIPGFQNSIHSGALGAAWALVITECLIVVAGLAMTRRLLSTEMLSRLWKTVAATGLMAIAVVASGHTTLIVQVALGITVFAAVAVGLRLLKGAEVTSLRIAAVQALPAPFRPR
jgi:O-antigen/teichoic acid export membrane protein